MTADQTQAVGMTLRQKITAIVVLAVLGFLGWQVKGMFSGGTPSVATKGFASTNPSKPGQPPQNAGMPQPPQPVADPPAAPAMTPREAELMKLQQETEARYLAALNELQLLKIDREIAETNKAIASAKLDMVHSEKSIVELLSPASVPSNPYQAFAPTNKKGETPTPPFVAGAPAAMAQPGVMQTQPSYTVISVSEIQYRWAAVLGYQGSLYSVHVGDILPGDGSKVITINKSGVTLEKDGQITKVSMVPVI